jgi:hypothetical protein
MILGLKLATEGNEEQAWQAYPTRAVNPVEGAIAEKTRRFSDN